MVMSERAADASPLRVLSPGKALFGHPPVAHETEIGLPVVSTRPHHQQHKDARDAQAQDDPRGTQRAVSSIGVDHT